jgi:hypothetical protein
VSHSQTRVNKGFISPICCSSISRILEVDVGYKHFQGNSCANIYYGLAFRNFFILIKRSSENVCDKYFLSYRGSLLPLTIE